MRQSHADIHSRVSAKKNVVTCDIRWVCGEYAGGFGDERTQIQVELFKVSPHTSKKGRFNHVHELGGSSARIFTFRVHSHL